ncbi:hypothetical protein SKAU_G00106390 [Synaphobranchus kaupii]|uniref:Uncharacterized protein n=1 Tax=Synaphobranchus kaupii TaxID=118154 RepID=A0A9Q1G0K3_SYNKA|nr:hypothetical protein SKAU_G00106390 [Synaphobranchus kaupii]
MMGLLRPQGPQQQGRASGQTDQSAVAGARVLGNLCENSQDRMGRQVVPMRAGGENLSGTPPDDRKGAESRRPNFLSSTRTELRTEPGPLAPPATAPPFKLSRRCESLPRHGARERLFWDQFHLTPGPRCQSAHWFRPVLFHARAGPPRGRPARCHNAQRNNTTRTSGRGGEIAVLRRRSGLGFPRGAISVEVDARWTGSGLLSPHPVITHAACMLCSACAARLSWARPREHGLSAFI